MTHRTFHLLTLGLALSACESGSPSPVGPSAAGSARAGGAGRGLAASLEDRACLSAEVSPFIEFALGAAEGVTVSRQGDVFVGNTNTGEIWRAPKGDMARVSLLADLLPTISPFSFLLGLDVTPDGTLYAAVNAFADPAVHGLWRVAPDGDARRVAAAPPFGGSVLNDVVIDPRGIVYATESLGGAIWRLLPDGLFEKWIESDLLRGGVHPGFGVEFGANGIAYHDGALYAGIHLNGRVIRVPIEDDGSAGEPRIAVEDDALIGNDGLEVDPAGNIYVANNFANVVQRIRASDLGIETILATGLSAPASLAFTTDHRTLYVANLSTSAVVPAPYAPALVRASFATPVVSWRVCGRRD